MSDIEILDEMEPEEFCRAVKKECMEVDGEWVVRLVYADSTVKYVRNYMIPDGEES